MAVSDKDVIGELTGGGASIEDYFLIGHDICAINPSGLLTSLLVEDVQGEAEGEMHNAIVDFLRRRNVKIYQSYEDYVQQRPKP